MSNSYGITPDNLLRTLPEILRNDKKMHALASSIAQELSLLSDSTQLAAIYIHIDTLPEDILDTLARDFKVDWWGDEYTLEEKRNTLKASWDVHRHLGTKSAVENALSAIYADSSVAEWFEYGGEPYHFKLLIDSTFDNIDPVKHQQVLGRVEYYKNLRSLLDGVEYVAVPEGYCRSYAAVAAAGMQMQITVGVSVYGLG